MTNIKCEACGAPLEVEMGQTVGYCKFCGSKYDVSAVTKEDKDIELAKINLQAYKETEAAKQEHELTKIREEREWQQKQQLQQEERENKKAFKKGKFKKVLIFFIVFFSIWTVLALITAHQVCAAIGFIQLALVIFSWLTASQSIKIKIPGIHIISFIAALVLIIPFTGTVGFGSSSPDKQYEAFEWENIVLCDILPEPPSRTGEIRHNSNDRLDIYVSNVSNNDFQGYKKKCLEKGFNIDTTDSGSLFYADNEGGYQLRLSYNDKKKELNIRLEYDTEIETDFAETTPKEEETTSVTTGIVDLPNEDPRPQRNGFNQSTNLNVRAGDYIISVPSYWEYEQTGDKSEDLFQRYAETNGKSAMIQINSKTNTKNPITFEELNSEKESIINAFLKSLDNDSAKCTNSGLYESNNIKGIYFDFTLTMRETGVQGITVIFPSEKDKKLIFIVLMVSENTEYRYDEDFYKMLDSIKKSEDTAQTSVPLGIRPKVKEAIDSYEAFYDEYIAFMKKYQSADSSDLLGMMTDYLNMIEKESEMADKMDALEDDMNDAELEYYLEVTTRVMQKMSGII